METRRIKLKGRELKFKLRDEADRSVFNEIFIWHEYRAVEECLLTMEQGVVVDAGAHAGFFSVFGAVLAPLARIFAVEPAKDNLLALKKHLDVNLIKNVTIIPLALAKETGERLLFSPTGEHHNYSISEINKKEGKKIKALSFGDFKKENKIREVFLLKMDVEGAEKEILNGFIPDDWVNTRTIILEYHNYSENTDIILEKMLREHGFSVSKFPSKFDRRMGFLWAKNKRV